MNPDQLYTEFTQAIPTDITVESISGCYPYWCLVCTYQGQEFSVTLEASEVVGDPTNPEYSFCVFWGKCVRSHNSQVWSEVQARILPLVNVIKGQMHLQRRLLSALPGAEITFRDCYSIIIAYPHFTSAPIPTVKGVAAIRAVFRHQIKQQIQLLESYLDKRESGA